MPRWPALSLTLFNASSACCNFSFHFFSSSSTTRSRFWSFLSCHTQYKGEHACDYPQFLQITTLTHFLQPLPLPFLPHRLVGLVVRRPPREWKIPGSNPACAGIFSGSSHTSDLKIGTPVATLPGAWCYKVSTGAGRPGVSILWLGEVERLIRNFYLSVAARKIVWADQSLRYISLLLGC